MERPAELPDYRKPPIDEVALGIQFKAIEGFTDAHIGLLWQRLRGTYPRTQSRPRADVPIESLGRTRDRPPALSFSVERVPDSQSGRTWLISDTDAFLLQVQDTQFLHNWRRRESEYPHLEEVSSRFWEGFDQFTAVIADERLPSPELQQLELSYFNWIPSKPLSAFFLPARAAAVVVGGLTGEPEELAMVASYLDEEEPGKPIARLRVECQPAFRVSEEGGEWGAQFVLAYKAPIDGEPDRERIDELVMRGRDVIVHTFTALTTDEAQAEWERFK